MAGYIITLDSIDSLKLYAESGIYATKLQIKAKDKVWSRQHEGTFADYVTMKQGDNIYFFIKRMIYGIGELIDLEGDCKFSNFPGASVPGDVEYSKIKNKLLWDEGEKSKDQRWLCVFRPAPFFFINGIDMDEALASAPNSFRILRALWKVSFIKVDNHENQALKNAILKGNQNRLSKPDSKVIYSSSFRQVHQNISKKLKSKSYSLEVATLLNSAADGKKLKHEMALEAAILHQLTIEHKETVELLGYWDYLSHQVIASPFKPIDYMDKMDVFGYRYITGYSPTLSKYLVIELKVAEAESDNVDQLLKYVDWLRDEYTFGDYSMISAVLITYNFSKEVIDYSRKVGVRQFTKGARPAQSHYWNDLKLISYEYDSKNRNVNLTNIS